MVIDEDWGISTDRITQFFQSQPDVTKNGSGISFGSCRVTLTPRDGRIGTWTMPRTQVRLEGPASEVEAIHRRFFLHFLSAGG